MGGALYSLEGAPSYKFLLSGRARRKVKKLNQQSNQREGTVSAHVE